MKRPQITAIASSKGSIALSWTPPSTSSRIMSYVVDYVVDGKRHHVEDVMTTTFRLKTDVEGVYSFTVASRTAKNQSPASLPVRIHHVLEKAPVESDPEPEVPEPEPEVPTPNQDPELQRRPTGLVVRPISATSASIRWDPMPNCKSFVLKMKSSVPGSKVGRITVPGTECTVDVDDLELGVSYTISITADGSPPSDAYVYTLAKRAPSRPLNLRVENDTTLVWDKPEDGSGVPVTYSVTDGTTTIYNVDEERYDFPNIPMNRPITFHVTASNAYGDSPQSPPFTHTFRRTSGLDVPAPPQNLTARSKKDSVSLRWQRPLRDGNSPVTRYTVSWSSEVGGGTVDSLSTETIVSGLQMGILYTFEVLATNAIGSSETPAVITSIPSDKPKKAPRNLSVRRVSPTRVALEWILPEDTLPESIDSYTIDMKSALHYGTLSEIRDTKLEVNIKRDQTYTFAIAAANASGLGPFSGVVELH